MPPISFVTGHLSLLPPATKEVNLDDSEGEDSEAEAQLDDARKKETADTNNYQMLRQSLEDQISYGNKELAEAKNGISEASEKKATAEGDLAVTSKELAEDVKAKATLHHDCMTRAENFEAETKSRGEELAALAKAKQIIREATAAASSFLQIASSADASIEQSVRFVRELAGKHHSNALAQLAAKMTSAMHGRDQFAKVKGLIRDMIARLEEEAAADAAKKAWCDRQLADTRQRKAEKTAEIAKQTTRIDKMTATSAQLKEEVAQLQDQLAKLAASQAEMDKLRAEQKAAYESARADLEKGLTGLKMALKVLNDYYAGDHDHDEAEGASSGIIGLLEVCESDFTRDLARTIADEESAVAEYEKVTKENEIERTTKTQDVKYKVKEFKRLDGDVNELTTDRGTVQTELDATNEALAKLEDQCIEKAETYEQRKARHAAEIAGLKEALEALSGALVKLAPRKDFVDVIPTVVSVTCFIVDDLGFVFDLVCVFTFVFVFIFSSTLLGRIDFGFIFSFFRVGTAEDKVVKHFRYFRCFIDWTFSVFVFLGSLSSSFLFSFLFVQSLDVSSNLCSFFLFLFPHGFNFSSDS